MTCPLQTTAGDHFARPLIAQSGYVDMLQWGSKTLATASCVYNAYSAVIISALHSFLQEDPSLLESFSSLNSRSKELIVHAPETYNLLTKACRNDPSPLLRSLQNMISIEHYRSGNTSWKVGSEWAADGSIFASAQGVALAHDSDGWPREGSYSAPLLNGRIPIDYCSPYSRRPMPVAEFRPIKYGEPTAFDVHLAKHVVAKIQAAYDSVRSVCPIASIFFNKNVKSIVVRRNNDVKAFQSASRNAYIGEVVLLNPQSEFVDTAYMAESLVHESIHALMWRAEVLSHFLTLSDQGEVICVSPWTGQKIFYYTLLQAVFVWYGVYHFWLEASKATVFDSYRVEKLKERAASGFRSDRFLVEIALHSHLLQNGIFETFVEMQRVVNSR